MVRVELPSWLLSEYRNRSGIELRTLFRSTYLLKLSSLPVAKFGSSRRVRSRHFSEHTHTHRELFRFYVWVNWIMFGCIFIINKWLQSLLHSLIWCCAVVDTDSVVENLFCPEVENAWSYSSTARCIRNAIPYIGRRICCCVEFD
jgi:hypothetical protein